MGTASFNAADPRAEYLLFLGLCQMVSLSSITRVVFPTFIETL